MRFSDGCGFLNSVANDQAVFAQIAMRGQSQIDLTPIWQQCVGIEDAEGGFVFHRITPEFFEVHTLFKPNGGARSKTTMALEMMFCATDCTEIVTRVPCTNRAASLLARRAGFRHRYRIPLGFDGPLDRVDCDHFGLTLWDWIIGNSTLIKHGNMFHEQLERVIGDLSHPDDEVHNAFVGYLRLCLRWGNVHKGINEYNRWAIVSGYQPLSYDGEYIMFDNVKIDSDENIIAA